jgi:hypothetical protein
MATTTVSIDDRFADVRQIAIRASSFAMGFVFVSAAWPWARSATMTDGFLKLRLGSKTDIRVPQGAVSATIDLIGNPDQTVELK